MPTLGERSHEEVVEIASHLGELPLAPFPALAHLCGGDTGDGVVSGQVCQEDVSSPGRRGRNEALLVTVYSMCVCKWVCMCVCECGEVWLLLPLFPSSLSLFCFLSSLLSPPVGR